MNRINQHSNCCCSIHAEKPIRDFQELKTKRTTGATDGPKGCWLLHYLASKLRTALAGCRRVDARFTLAA